MTPGANDLLDIFWVEAREYLETLNRLLLALETAAPEDDVTPSLREVARIAHSLKGAARAVGQGGIEQIAHEMESIFDLLLSGAQSLTPALADTLYDGLDVIQMISNGQPPGEDTLHTVLAGLREIGADADGSKRQTLTLPPAQTTAEMPAVGEESVRVRLDKLDRLMAETGELLLARMQAEQRRADAAALLDDHRRWAKAWRQTRTAYIRASRRLRSAFAAGEDAALTPELRADLLALLDFLDHTQQYQGESRRALTALNRGLTEHTHHLATLVDSLQADIASARMLPVATILGGFQRMVRDLARADGKEVALLVEGAEVEVDKYVLEMLKDPLMHLLRNAVDHGVAAPEARAAANKAPTGTITLTITPRGGEIQVTVEDDGDGIDLDAVRQQAVARGLVAGDAGELDAQALAALIFAPGLTTSAAVTAVSGRGIGLDVVRERVEALRGRLWVENMPGFGAVFHLVVPVSLTRTRCLLVRAGGEVYAVPLANVQRLLSAGPDHVFSVEGRPMLRVDDQPLPVLALADALDRPGDRALAGQTPALILRSAEQASAAFFVDDLVSEAELVIKPLGAELRRVRGVAGAAILGTGRVVIVLNVGDLVKRARRVNGQGGYMPPAPVAESVPTPRRVLVVDDSITTRTLEKNILEAAGYDVETATDAAQALARLADSLPDVIVADVEMPGMDGCALTEQIKHSPQWQHIPVILVTSLDSAGARERGLRAGADAYLVKSQFDQDELLNVIELMV